MLNQQLTTPYPIKIGLPVIGKTTKTVTTTPIGEQEDFDKQTVIVIWQYFLNDIEYAALRVSDLPPVGIPPEIARESQFILIC